MANQVKKKNSSTILQRNFSLFYDILKMKHDSYGRVFIFLGVTYIHLVLSQMRTYDSLIRIHYDFDNIKTTTSTILTGGVYVDAQGQLRLNIYLYFALYVLFILMTIGNTLNYLYIMYLYTQEEFEPRKTPFGKAVEFFSVYMSWLLFHPCIIAFTEQIYCDQEFSNALNLSCGINNLPMTIFSFLGIFFGIINQVVITLFFQNSSDVKKDAFNTENVVYLTSFQIFRAINAILCVLRPDSYGYYIFYLIFTYTSTVGFLMNIFYGSGFLAFSTSFTRKYFIILLTGYLSLTSAQILDELMRLCSYYTIMQDDSLIFSVFFGFFYYFVLFNLIGSFNLHSRVSELIANISSSHLKFQVYAVYAILEVSVTRVDQDSFLKSLIQRHIDSNCTHPVLSGLQKCFCRRSIIFDSKKVKDATIEKWITNKTIFVKFLLKSWMETFIHYHPTDAKIKILYAKFLFEKLRNHQMALQTLCEVERRFLYVLERYDVFKLRMQISKWVKEKNFESFKGRLDLENALLVEGEIDSIKQKIKQVLAQNCKFWSLLQRNIISQEELNELLKNQFKEVGHTKDLWISVHQYLEYKKKWKFYYAWFTMYVLNKKVKNRILENFSGVNVNENDIFSEEVQETNVEEDIVSIQSGLLFDEVQDKIDIKNKKIIFDKKSAILHTNDDKLATILNVNKQFQKVFGYSRSECVQVMDIQELMPPFFAKHHPHQMEEFKLSGKSNCLYSQNKIFCLHKSGYIFTAWKFVKFFLTIDCESQFVAMIRPTDYNNDKKQDILLFNNDWDLEGMTLNLIQTLNISPSMFSKNENLKQIINLLTIAPKLIQYSKISKYLKETDLQLLGMIRNRRQDAYKFPQKSLASNLMQETPQINIQNSTTVVIQIPNQDQTPDSNQIQPSLSFSQFQDAEATQLLCIQDPQADYKMQNSFGDRLQATLKKFERQISEDPNQQEIDREDYEDQQMRQEMKRVAHKRLSYVQHQELSIQNLSQQASSQQEESSETEIDSQEDNYLITDIKKIKKIKKSYGLMQDNLEGGEPINFIFKIPDELIQLSQSYKLMKLATQAIKTNFEEKQAQKAEAAPLIINQQIIQRQQTVQKDFKKKTRLVLSKAIKQKIQDEENKLYDLILSLYKKYHGERTKSRKFKSTCFVKFKKIRSERIGIMKITTLQKLARQKRKIVPQISQQGVFKKHEKWQDQQQLTPNTLNNQSSPKNLQSLFLDSKMVSIRSQSHMSDDISFQNSPSMGILQVDQDALNQNIKHKMKIQKKTALGQGFQIKNMDEGDQLMHIDEFDNKQMVDWSQFQNQFKMQQGSQNISLNPMDNIFRKEDNNKPNRHLSKISYLGWFLRLMFFAILIINLFTFFWGPQQTFPVLVNDCERTYELSETLLETLNIYGFFLNNNFLGSCLDILIFTPNNTNYSDLRFQNSTVNNSDNFFAFVNVSISVAYQFLKKSIVDIDQQHVFLDDRIFNDSSVEDPAYEVFNVELDQQDQLSQFVMRAHQLDLLPIPSILLNDTNIEYVRFVTLPYLFFSLSDSVTSLIKQMQATVDNIEQFLVIVLIMESCIFFIGFFALLKIILWISETFKTVLCLFQNISHTDLQKISGQQQFIKNQFDYIIKKDDELVGFKDLDDDKNNTVLKSLNQKNFQNMGNFLINEEEAEQNVIFVKKNKVIQHADFFNKLTLKLSFAYLIFVLATAACSLAFHISLKMSANNLRSSIQTGYLVVDDYSNAQVLMLLVKEKFYDQTNYQQQLYPLLQKQVATVLNRMQVTPSNNHMTFGSFDVAFNQLYFGNICTFLQQNNNIDESHFQECSTISLNKLQLGIVAFNQYLISMVQDIVLNQDDYRFGNTNQIKIWEYSLSVEYLKQGYRTLLSIWNTETQNKLNNDLMVLTVLISVVLVIQLGVFLIIAESYLINQLSTTYLFYRQVYKAYMPNDIIQKVKIIRAKLVIYGIINKQQK